MSITLTNHATMALCSILRQPGWARGIEDVVLGGSLLVEKFGALKPEFADKEQTQIFNRWLEAVESYELTDKQQEAVKHALTTHGPKMLPPGPVAMELLAVFKVAA